MLLEGAVVPSGYRRCTACLELKPVTEFYARRAQCKPCYLAKVKVWQDRWSRRKRGEQIPYLTEIKGHDLPQSLDPHFLAWLAGFVDGEGCFSILRTKNRSGTYNRRPILVISQATSGVLYLIQDTLGCGGVYGTARSAKKESGFACFQYQVAGQAALAVTQALLPYLKVKQEVASLFVTFKSAAGSTQFSLTLGEIHAEQEGLAEAIHALNAPGSSRWRSRPVREGGPPPKSTN